MANVEFYYYLGCPWTYLAFVRLRETAMRTGAGIIWRPILIERVKAAIGAPATAHGGGQDARSRYQVKDLADWARFCGLAMRRAGPYPLAAGWAMRGAVVADREGAAVAYCEAVFRSAFEAQGNADDLDAVTLMAAQAGLDAKAFREGCISDHSAAIVLANSDELVARGGFGSPTMFIGEDMYFGNDRMPLVELALSRAAERPLVVPGAHGQS